ncbi:MAG: hypothetical protein JSU63_00205 [Phycisphaerales bacterium]|nr:MAG: hypothetical protein JSU63_00205 [Phycisphaerales bacterium]
MGWLRNSLALLGWPVDFLSDESIARELYNRWFMYSGCHPDPDAAPSVAAAKGIFVTLSKEGNLDALCWSADGDFAAEDDLLADEMELFEGKDETDGLCNATPYPDRREFPREPARDLVAFTVPATQDQAGGWLVDVSAASVAFIAETKDVPPIGTSIIPTISKRAGAPTELSSATVVRTELLTDLLSLVCARLDKS